MTVDSLVKNLLDKLLPNRAAPVLGRVIKAHAGSGRNAYSVDVRVVKAGSLEETKQVIAEVPISPMWVGKKAKGVYAVPPEDSLVIVEFLEWNPAFPFVSGVWSDEYEAGEFAKEHFVITDGKGFKLDFSEGDFILTDGAGMTFEFVKGSLTVSSKDGAKVGVDTDSLLLFKSAQQSLKAVLDKIVDETAAIQTQGAPPQHVVSPVSVQKLLAIKPEIAKLLK